MRLRITYEPKEAITIVGLANVASDPFEDIANVPAHKLDEHLSVSKMVGTGIMPAAVRYLSPKRDVLLWERAPGYVTLNFSPVHQSKLGTDDQSMNQLRIPLPWQRYVATLTPEGKLGALFGFFAQHEIQSLNDDPLYLIPIHNFFQEGRLCQAAFSTIKQYDPTVAGAIDAIYEGIWNSGFNTDTDRAWRAMGNMKLPGSMNPLATHMRDLRQYYRKWSASTLDEVMSWSWPPAYSSFEHLKSSGHLREGIDTTSEHEFLVRMMFAAQDAAQI